MKIAKPEVLGVSAIWAAALPTAIYWHAVNRGYPHGDYADYFWHSLKIYRHFMSGGLASGFRALYMIRNMRGTISPLLAVPGFLFLGPHVLLVQAVTQLFLYAVLAVIAYALCRLFLPVLDSVLVTSVALNFPSLHEKVYFFNSELPFAVFLLATLLAFAHSDHFLKKWPTLIAAVSLGLAFCTRPAETALAFAIVLPFLIYSALKQGKWNTQELKYAGILALIFSLATAWASRNFDSRPFDWFPTADIRSGIVADWGLGIAWVVYLLRFRKKVRSRFPIFVLLAASVAILWFEPFLHQAIRWILFCSYKRSPFPIMQEPRINAFHIYESFYERYVGPGSLGLFVLCTVFGWKALSRKTASISLKTPLVVGLLAFVAHLSLGVASFNPFIRYYSLDIAVLSGIFLVIFFQSQSPRQSRRQSLRWTRRTAATALFAFLILTQLNAYGVIESPVLGRSQSAFGEFGEYGKSWDFANVLPTRGEDPAAPVFRAVLSQLRENPNAKGCIYRILPTRFLPLDYAMFVMEPFALRLIALENDLGSDPKWEYPEIWDWRQWYPLNKELYDYCLIGPLERAKPEFLEQLHQEKSVSTQNLALAHPRDDSSMTLLLAKWRR